MDPLSLLVVVGATAFAGWTWWKNQGDEPTDPPPPDFPQFPVDPPSPSPFIPSFNPTPEADPPSGGGGSPSIGSISLGDPPNISLHPAGYNLNLFPNWQAVRAGLRSLGYAMADNNTPPPSVDVKLFQMHYNDQVEAGFPDIVGHLREDGKGGKHTYNAIEMIMGGPDGIDLGDIMRPLNWRIEVGL